MIMSPEGAFLTLVLAVLIDTWGIGGAKFAPLFDRLAFIGWVAVFAVGFEGAGLTEMVNGTVNGLFAGVAGLWNAPLWRGAVVIGPQIIGWVVAAVTVGAMLPQRVRVLGQLSRLQFAHLRQGGSRGGAGRGDATGGGWVRKLFPGSVNLGLVALALLLVTTTATVHGGIGTAMHWGVNTSVAIAAGIVHPLLASTGVA
jgi:hypothetical protein